MQKISISLCSHGTRYDPVRTQAKAGVTFDRLQPRGQIAARGRYKGQPLPYGSSALECPQHERMLSEQSVPFFQSARAVVDAAKSASHYIDILIQYDDQPSCEMSSGFVAALERVGVHVHITFYKGDNSVLAGDSE